MKDNKIRPSNSERMLNCNLSLWLPKKEKTMSQEKYLAERSKDHERLSKGLFLETEEQCRRYQKFVLKRCGSNTFVEEKLSASIGETMFKGTPDLFGFDGETKTLYVVDYKTGFHNVSAWGNSQLMSYAVLVLLTKKEWDIESFKLSILNTKADLCSHFEPAKEKILLHIARIKQSLKFISDGTAYAVTGDWCKFCPSKDYCPLHREIPETKNYYDIDTDHLLYAKHKRQIELAKREKALLQETGLSDVFDYKLVNGPKRFKLKPEAPKELLEVKKLMTPTEAKKVLTEGQFQDCFDEEQPLKLAIGDEK